MDFVLRQREVGRGKELSAASRNSNFQAGRRIKTLCATCHCENNKTLLLINTTFTPSTTSADKIFCNWKAKKRKPISVSAILTNKMDTYRTRWLQLTYCAWCGNNIGKASCLGARVQIWTKIYTKFRRLRLLIFICYTSKEPSHVLVPECPKHWLEIISIFVTFGKKNVSIPS